MEDSASMLCQRCSEGPELLTACEDFGLLLACLCGGKAELLVTLSGQKGLLYVSLVSRVSSGWKDVETSSSDLRRLLRIEGQR